MSRRTRSIGKTYRTMPDFCKDLVIHSVMVNCIIALGIADFKAASQDKQAERCVCIGKHHLFGVKSKPGPPGQDSLLLQQLVGFPETVALSYKFVYDLAGGLRIKTVLGKVDVFDNPMFHPNAGFNML